MVGLFLLQHQETCTIMMLYFDRTHAPMLSEQTSIVYAVGSNWVNAEDVKWDKDTNKASVTC